MQPASTTFAGNRSLSSPRQQWLPPKRRRGLSGSRCRGWSESCRIWKIWVAEFNGVVVGWGAIRGDMLEGLYTAPEFAGQGVGAGLLIWLEALMREREFRSVRLEASSNARGFYRRRGYRATGPQTADGAWPMVK